MPTPPKAEKPDTDAADKAVLEVEAEEAADSDVDADKIAATHGGVQFTISRRKLDSVQFRRLMQRGRDILALEYLLGVEVVSRIIAGLADDEGITSADDFDAIFETIGNAVGSGN